ncbi:MAG: 16S rRNA processing protein RimM [Candidatus Rokuibacteriota bacterium]|nr:MAG: 16S rRNA processing protein RimM [Candidatus Rokubacteria bacterium]
MDRLIAIGEIVRPHGVRGEVRVTPLTDRPERFEGMTTCVLWDAARDEREPRRVTAARRQGDAVLLALEGVESPEAARAFVGRLVAVPASQALPPKPGSFYPWQLEGARVTTEDGREIGRLARIDPGPGQDLWVVQGADREHLIPAVAEIVVDIDVAAGRIVIRPPAGLLEL